MSIIVCIASEKDAVIASDGRKFSSVLIESGDKSKVVDDFFDKTFFIENKFIGAFCGLVEFNYKKIGTHVQDVFNKREFFDLSSFVEFFIEEFKVLLSNIDNNEVDFPFRKSNIIIAGGSSFERNNFKVYTMDFYPENNAIICKKDIGKPSPLYYSIRGDDLACESANVYVKKETSNDPRCHSSFLEKIAKESVKEGIKDTGNHPLSINEKACGGKIFYIKTIYR